MHFAYITMQCNVFISINFTRTITPHIMKVKTQKTVKEGESVGNGADTNGNAAGDGAAAGTSKVCPVKAQIED